MENVNHRIYGSLDTCLDARIRRGLGIGSGFNNRLYGRLYARLGASLGASLRLRFYLTLNQRPWRT